MRRRDRPTQPTPVGSFVPRVLRELGLEEAAAVLRVAESWESAVGSGLAAHCRPVVLRGDVLEVDVDSSVWGQQVQLQRLEILGRLRELLGTNAPRDLRTRMGNRAEGT